MAKTRYIDTGLFFRAVIMMVLLFGTVALHAQDDMEAVEIDMDGLSIPGYRLAYGNARYRMEDFFLLPNSRKLLLLSSAGRAVFMLLDERHLPIDTIEFASALANIQFWMDSDSTFSYNSIFFYKSKLCPIDYKSGVAEFAIRRNALNFKRCYPIDRRHSVHRTFAQVKDFKVSIFALPAKKRKRSGAIGVEVNGSTIIRHELPQVDSLYAEVLLPFAELNGELYVYDVLSHTLHRCLGPEHTYRPVHLSASPRSDTTWVSSYRLLPDEHTGRLYLLESYSVGGERRRRGRLQAELRQRLYSLDASSGTVWQPVELPLPYPVSQMRIANGGVYAIFERPMGNGRTERLLYESQITL